MHISVGACACPHRKRFDNLRPPLWHWLQEWPLFRCLLFVENRIILETYGFPSGAHVLSRSLCVRVLVEDIYVCLEWPFQEIAHRLWIFRPVPWISLKCKSSCVSSFNLSCTCSRLSVAGSSLVSVRYNYPDAPGWGFNPCTLLSTRVTGEIQMFRRCMVSEIASLSGGNLILSNSAFIEHMCFSLILRFWNNILHFAHHWGMCKEKKILFWLHMKFYFKNCFVKRKAIYFPKLKLKWIL